MYYTIEILLGGMFAHPILKGVALILKQAEQFVSEDSQERYCVETDILGSNGGRIYYE